MDKDKKHKHHPLSETVVPGAREPNPSQATGRVDLRDVEAEQFAARESYSAHVNRIVGKPTRRFVGNQPTRLS